ncbi:MAG TPA: hypothetical protein VNY29_12170 [Terriglobales bacterium]|jgi:hypothetical protein|nr:hypothetical protein [Terriglobales bacterium]
MSLNAEILMECMGMSHDDAWAELARCRELDYKRVPLLEKKETAPKTPVVFPKEWLSR